jgi:NTP pyrophosphatase (non-canonical NTP hydrolase)
LNQPNFQQRVAAFVTEHHLETDPSTRLLDLLSELGEAAKEILKGSSYGKDNFSTTAQWEGELADVFFSLVCLANSTGVDLEAALDMALEKYQARLESRGNAGSNR